MENKNTDTEILTGEIDETAVDHYEAPDTGANDAENQDDEEVTPETVKKYKELANNYKVRAEKAEARFKREQRDGDGRKPATRKSDAAEFSQSDMFALMRSNITDDGDIAQVSKFAKGLGITVQEALKDDTLQTILQRRAEMRKTAEATQTGNRRAGNQRTSDAKLVEEAERGIFPENEADIERLARARVMAKKARK